MELHKMAIEWQQQQQQEDKQSDIQSSQDEVVIETSQIHDGFKQSNHTYLYSFFSPFLY
jgi:hypothetical protein